MEWEQKSWGRVWHFYQTRMAWGSYLEMDAGTRCSRHHHVYKHNFFALIAGLVLIEAKERTLMHPGQTLIVPAGVVHRFRVLQPSRMIELYSPISPFYSIKPEDIVREDEGGADDIVELRRIAGV